MVGGRGRGPWCSEPPRGGEDLETGLRTMEFEGRNPPGDKTHKGGGEGEEEEDDDAAKEFCEDREFETMMCEMGREPLFKGEGESSEAKRARRGEVGSN